MKPSYNPEERPQTIIHDNTLRPNPSTREIGNGCIPPVALVACQVRMLVTVTQCKACKHKFELFYPVYGFFYSFRV